MYCLNTKWWYWKPSLSLSLSTFCDCPYLHDRFSSSCVLVLKSGWCWAKFRSSYNLLAVVLAWCLWSNSCNSITCSTCLTRSCYMLAMEDSMSFSFCLLLVVSVVNCLLNCCSLLFVSCSCLLLNVKVDITHYMYSVHLFACLSIKSSNIHPFVHPSIHSENVLFINLHVSVHLFIIYLSICSYSIHSIHLSIHYTYLPNCSSETFSFILPIFRVLLYFS